MQESFWTLVSLIFSTNLSTCHIDSTFKIYLNFQSPPPTTITLIQDFSRFCDYYLFCMKCSTWSTHFSRHGLNSLVLYIVASCSWLCSSLSHFAVLIIYVRSVFSFLFSQFIWHLINFFSQQVYMQNGAGSLLDHDVQSRHYLRTHGAYKWQRWIIKKIIIV